MIRLTNLHKALDPSTVINIPSLLVNAGGVVAVIGPVDSGRDALFQLLTGAIRPTSASVRLAGLDPFALPAAARGTMKARK